MPAFYTYDRTVKQESAGKYKSIPTPNATAFHPNAPKPLVKALEPHIPQGIQKIPPPKGMSDDSFGQVTASFVHKTIRATPFNNKLKGNPKEQFKLPSFGKVGKQSTDTVSTFANRVKRVIEYLRALQRPDMEDIFKSLMALYVSDRLPNKKELEQIDAVEKLIFQYNIVPPPAPLRVEIPPEPQYSPIEDASPIQIDLVDTIRPLNIETSPSAQTAQTVPTAEPITPHHSQLRPEFVLPLKGRKEVRTLGPLLDDLRETLGSSDDSDLESDAPFRESMLEVFSAEEEVSSAEEKYEPYELKVPGLDQEVVAKIQEHLSQRKKNPRIPGVSKEQLAIFYEYKIEKFREKHGRLPTTAEAKLAKIPYHRLKSYSERT
jgi:hypothetical protein